jgi:hypothetical protein
MGIVRNRSINMAGTKLVPRAAMATFTLCAQRRTATVYTSAMNQTNLLVILRHGPLRSSGMAHPWMVVLPGLWV